MLLSADKGDTDWTVYHAQERRELRYVSWVDTESLEWCQYIEPVTYLWGIAVTEIRKADAMEIDEAARRVTINPGSWPEVPPPVWDRRPVDADRAMEAVRALCG